MQFSSILIALLAANLGSASPFPGGDGDQPNIYAREASYKCGTGTNSKTYTQTDINNALAKARKHMDTPNTKPKNQINNFPHSYVGHDAMVAAMPTQCRSDNRALRGRFEWPIDSSDVDRIIFGNDGRSNFFCMAATHRGQLPGVFVECPKSG